MRRSLDRVFRLRSLLEDVSRVELEARLQELALVEDALSRSQEIERDMRGQSFMGITEGRNRQRVESESLSEWMAWERGVYEKARRRKATAVDAAKAEYLERRKECGQVKSVMEAKLSAVAIVRSRREQRELDDWFGQRSKSNS